MYFSGGASCVMRHTQLAVSEMGSEKTLRRPKTAKPIIMKVEMRKPTVSRRNDVFDSSSRSQESTMASTNASAKA